MHASSVPRRRAAALASGGGHADDDDGEYGDYDDDDDVVFDSTSIASDEQPFDSPGTAYLDVNQRPASSKDPDEHRAGSPFRRAISSLRVMFSIVFVIMLLALLLFVSEPTPVVPARRLTGSGRLEGSPIPTTATATGDVTPAVLFERAKKLARTRFSSFEALRESAHPCLSPEESSGSGSSSSSSTDLQWPGTVSPTGSRVASSLKSGDVAAALRLALDPDDGLGASLFSAVCTPLFALPDLSCACAVRLHNHSVAVFFAPLLVWQSKAVAAVRYERRFIPVGAPDHISTANVSTQKVLAYLEPEAEGFAEKRSTFAGRDCVRIAQMLDFQQMPPAGPKRGAQ